jgi:putative peptidoglycan lipid II flippase
VIAALRGLVDWGRDILRRGGAHPVLREATRYAGLSVVVKVGALVKEVVVAAAFGVSGAMDAYLMAVVVIGFPAGVLASPVQTIYVRDYVLIKETRGEAAANRLLLGTVLAVLAVMTVVLIFWVAFLPHIVAFVGRGFTADQRSLVIDCVHALAINYVLTGVNLIGYGTLQARKDFTPGALTPLAVPVVTISMVLMFGGDLRALIWGLNGGALVETVLVYRRLARAGLTIFRLQWQPGDYESLRRLALGSAILMPTWLLTSLSPMIEQTIASSLGNGVVSSLGYAARLPTMIINILVTAVGYTVLPHFTEMLASRQIDRLRRFFVRYAVLLAVAGTLVAAASFALSEPFVRIAFQRGAFTIEDTSVVTGLQQAYLLQIPGALVGILSARVLVACGALRAVTAVFVIVVPFAGLTQWWLSSVLGPVGVAYGASLGVSLSAIFLTFVALFVSRKV